MEKILLKNNYRCIFLFAVWGACFSQLLITIIGGSTLELCPRYLTICAIKTVLLLGATITFIPIPSRIKYSMVTALVGLLFIQLFVTIDPSVTVFADTKYDGLHYLVFPEKNQVGNDLTFYNYEYCRDAKDGEKILSQLDYTELNNIYSDTKYKTGYKTAIGCSEVYAVYWDTVRQCRTYIPNENCVRLQTNNITDGMNSWMRYEYDNMTIILRDSLDYALEDYFQETKDKMIIGRFNVYK